MTAVIIVLREPKIHKSSINCAYTDQVQLVFQGTSYPNNSALPLNDIGTISTGSTILCSTNRSPCCSINPYQFGGWYYPNGSIVPYNYVGENFYTTRSRYQSIHLNRRNNAQSPTGSFCCELPDSRDITHRLCATLR